MNVGIGGVVPDPLDVWEVRTPDGSPIVVRRHGNPLGPAMLLGHGNGLAADAYFPFWSRFAERFDIFIHDIRNHGWNPVGDRRRHNVPQFVDDAECVARSIDRRLGISKPRVGMFHSLSAMVALRHAASGGRYAALVLFDLPVCPPGRPPADMERVCARLSSGALKRRQRF